MPRALPDNSPCRVAHGDLPDYLEGARRELRRAATIRGTTWMALALIGGLLLAGGIDFFLRSDANLSRWTLSLLAFLPAIIIGGIFVVLPWISRLSRIDLAKRIEHADPSWRGSLTSATAFLDPRSEYGSRPLQRHTLEIVQARIANEAGPRLVEWSGVRRSALFAAIALLVGVIVFALAPRSSTVAIARLAQPFEAIEWPRRVHLVMVGENGKPLSELLNISQGQTFRFFVSNARGKLPADLSLEVLGPGGTLRRESVPTAEEPPPGIESDRVGVAALYAGEGPLRFRVTGGDDRQMPFLTANVVVPPRLENLTVTVTPPAYLNAEPVTEPPGVTRIRGILGSTVTIRAEANKPLAAAELFVGDQPAPRPEIREQGGEVFAAFVLANERPSSYWFRLRDTSGFENPQAPRYEISTQIDAPPEIILEEPAADLTATPSATLPVAARASDDHGLTGVRLRFGRGTRLPDAQSTESNQESQVIPLLEAAERPREHARQFDWPLGTLGLAVGDQLTFRGEATDAYDLGPPRIGTSSPRTVTIVAPEAKRGELLDRQAALLSELSEAHRATFRLLESANSLAGELEVSKELRATHHDQLARAELEHQRLTENLVGPEESSEAAAAEMLAEFSANQIDDPALQARLQNITDELANLREDALAAATRHMTDARKATGADDAASALQSASRDLSVVEDGLESLLDELGAWRSRRDVLAEIRDLLELQQSLAEETTQTAGQTLGTATEELTPEQSSQLGSMGARQSSVAERLERLTKQLETLGESPDDEKPAQQENSEGVGESEEAESTKEGDPVLRDAAERLQSSGLATTARSAGEAIRENRLGEAGQFQSEILSELNGLRDTLAEQKPTTANDQQLRGLQQELETLSKKQQDVLETLRKQQSAKEQVPAEQREALRKTQAELRTSASHAARQARQAGARDASNALTKASSEMTQGLERLQREEDRGAEEALAEALESLRDAQSRVEEEIEKRGAQLADTIPASLFDQTRVLAQRQEALNQEVARLETLKTERGSLSRSQLLTLRDTRQAQATLVDETEALRETAPEALVIQFALESAAGHMRQAAEGLDRRDTGPATQHAGALALTRLEEIVTTIETANQTKPNPGQQGTPEQEAQEGPSSGAVSQLAQLELLRALQLDLQRRTKELEQGLGEESPTPAQQQEIEAIAREIAAIQELVSTILPKQPVEEALEP